MRLMRICWLLAVLCQLPYPVTSSSKSEETLQQVESSLMSLFGFKKRPKIDKSKIVIPQAMLEEYEKQTGKKLDTVNLRRPGINTQTANTMRSFVHVDSNLDSKFPGHHSFRLSFNISTIPEDEILKTSELLLNRDTISWMGEVEGNALEHYQTVMVYDILRPGKKGKDKASIRLIDVKKVDTRKSGTVSFNVQPAVLRWKQNAKKNFGLLIQINGHGSNKTTPARHVRVRRHVEEDESIWVHKQPILYTYTDDQKYKPVTGKEILEKRRKRAIHRKRKPKSACRRYSMYVDFSDVGWSNWIVAPPGYDAYYCSGECTFPFAAHMNTTNHAIVQTLINSVNRDEGVPKACCVPTQLSSVSMLYLDDEKRVVLKHYQEMAVVGCGCR